ncbi:hypothetical protein M8I34_32265 [Streptomyces sp. MCA2]|uniref:hypothetical protein n=1 Tax=Streptomyces sp. MCA2 TaxID=2944805 RepID=UPI0020229BF2|nr:hypothetical protein [Streptomyces sp. MCA2]MCL7496044.1 hypothetical protein [Streptomyces sp. MCA2]
MVRTADVPRPPRIVRRSERSSTTPSDAGRDKAVKPRSTDGFDSPRYDAIVSARAWHPSGRAPRALIFT